MLNKKINLSYENILSLIGNTPLVKINKLNSNQRVKIWAKLEYYNPTGSLKDRIGLKMIEIAEKKGLLKDKIILEATSGNTGISLAWISWLKGYKCVLVLPKSTSPLKQGILKSLGAKLIFTPPPTDKAEKKARQLAKNPRYFFTNQFANQENWKTHYQTTGKEIWEQTKGKVTHVIVGMGTGGTIMGVARRLREYNPKIKIIGVVPAKFNHKQEGLRSLKESVPEILKLDEIDQIIKVRDEQALCMKGEILSKEGLPVGVSSGTVMWGALKLIKKLHRGVLVCVFADNMFRYLH